jgi:hypothetical protein
VNECLKRQWDEQTAQNVPEDERKLGPGCGNWDENNVLPNNVKNNLSSLERHAVKLNPGDAVICHYLLVHEVAPNYEDDIRMQLYVRVKSQEYHPMHSMLDVRRDFYG